MTAPPARGAIRIETLAGESLARRLSALGALRIAVFRAFPYLYDGDPTYEARYLETYAASAGAVVIAAFDGETLIGAATAAPMEDHDAGFAEAFAAHGIDSRTLCYFGESVLLPAWRGRGIGHLFFDAREAHARTLGRSHATFCAVIRADDHVDRPADYRPLDGFWRGRGYAPVPGLIAPMHWRDIGMAAETAKPMQFWMRAL